MCQGGGYARGDAHVLFPLRPSLLFTPYSSMHVPCLRSGKNKWEILNESVVFLEQDFMDIQL